MSMAPKRTHDEGDPFRSLRSGFRGPDHAEEREARARREGYDAARRDSAMTETAAADAVTEIATDRARVREQRDRALDLAEAALGAKGVYDRPRLLEELARLRRVVAGSAGTETGTDTEHPEEGR